MNFRKSFLSFILLALVIASVIPANGVTGEAHRLTIEERRFDFTQLINQINVQYGPKLYKRKAFGISINELSKKYWPMIKNAKTNGEFYSLIVQFVAEFKDGHFGARIPTRLRAFLPFGVSPVQGKILLEYVMREYLPEEEFPFVRGDELLEMNGTPVEILVEELKKYVGSGNPRDQLATAVYFLTWRPGSTLPVPEGEVSVTLRSKSSGKTRTVTLEWIRKGEAFDETSIPAINAIKAMVSSADKTEPVFQTDAFNPLLKSSADIIYNRHPFRDGLYLCSGTTRIEIPEDATILMEEPFVAYYYPTPKGNVGYLRIPHFYPQAFGYNTEDWLLNYEWAATKLEANTVGLIIDQDHNCGGGDYEGYFIVSLLMDREFDAIPERFRASKMELLNWKSWLDSFESHYFMEYEGLLSAYLQIEASFEKGEYLTPKTSMWGDIKIKPKNVYTKPIVLLIDYAAGSWGDAFPSLMQGNNRAKLVGTTTGGLGGYINQMEPLSYSQIKLHMTQSMFYHPNGNPIENIGVSPDVPYEITVDDFINGYKGYREFYTSELLKLVR